MKAVDLQRNMREIGTWVDWDNTVDRFVVGDPETEVKGIAVAWRAGTDALREAVDKGCNLFVCHENVFYRHWDNDETILKQPHVVLKRQFIEDHGIVIFRCHDTWDRMPEIGIVDSWAAYLGLKQKVNSDTFHAVYLSPRPTLIELAQQVARAVPHLDVRSVHILGDPNAKVSRVGIGCGAITKKETMVTLGADALIVTDDGIEYLGDGGWALDSGTSMIVVNHATSEEPGVRNLAKYIEEKFPEVKTVYLPQGCMYRAVDG